MGITWIVDTIAERHNAIEHDLAAEYRVMGRPSSVTQQRQHLWDAVESADIYARGDRMYRVGEFGLVIAKNPSDAVFWWKRAAEEERNAQSTVQLADLFT